MNFLSSFASWFEGDSASVAFALVGGFIVACGLGIEKIADILDDRFLGGYKAHKTMECVGWNVLMLGIWIEIADAGWSAHEIKQAETIAIKNDLHEQPIFAMSGYATVLLRPSINLDDLDNATFSNLDMPPSLFRVRLPNNGNVNVNNISLMFGRAIEIENSEGSDDAFISSDNVSESISTFGGERLLRFDIYFGENQDSFQNASLTPDSFDALDLVLPTSGEIISGNVVISIDHDFIKRTFQIPKQTMFGASASSVASNGTFAPLNWSPQIRSDFEKSENIRLKKADLQAKFQARGQELEFETNNGKKQRTISDEQKRLFVDLLKDYPKMSIKVFVNSNDDEAVNYAKNIRGLLASAKYGEETDGVIEDSKSIIFETNQVPWQPSSNMLGFVLFQNAASETWIPVSIPYNDIKPRISAGLTNDRAMYTAGALDCVKWAFSGIGVGGFYIPDTNVLKAGEAGIIVTPKPK